MLDSFFRSARGACRIIPWVILILVCASARAQYPGEKDRYVQTVAGIVSITKSESAGIEGAYTVSLGAKKLLTTGDANPDKAFSDFPHIDVVRHFKRPITPFDEAILFQQYSYGNACNGSSFWVLGLNKDGSYRISKTLDFCGGPSAKVFDRKDGFVVYFPGGPPNIGKGYIPPQTWVFRNGAFVRVARK